MPALCSVCRTNTLKYRSTQPGTEVYETHDVPDNRILPTNQAIVNVFCDSGCTTVMKLLGPPLNRWVVIDPEHDHALTTDQ